MTLTSPHPVPLSTFLSELCGASASSACDSVVGDVLGSCRPSLDSLGDWIRFHPEHYARHRLYRNDQFEVLLLCWDEGQCTPIHDHDGQAGWITVLEGHLGIQEYKRLGGPKDLREFESLVETPDGTMPLSRGSRFRVAAGTSVAEAEPPEAIHSVGPENGRALSLHVYSRPFDSFLVFDEQRQSARRIVVTPPA